MGRCLRFTSALVYTCGGGHLSWKLNIQPVCFTSFLFISLFSHRIADAVGLAWPVLISYKSFERMKVAVQASEALIINGCMFWLFFVVSEFMFSMKAAIFLSVRVTIECWTCIYSYSVFLGLLWPFSYPVWILFLAYAGSFTRAFCQNLERCKYHSASFSYPFMHKCNSTLNTLSSIANQTASSPLAIRFWAKFYTNR